MVYPNQLLPHFRPPAPFKTATVKLLLKKPTLDSADIRCYRPVSFLSFLTKTLKQAVDNQLSSCLSQNNFLDPNQSGFRTGHSSEMGETTFNHVMSVGVHQRALYNRLSLCHLIDVQDGQSEISSCAGHVSRVMGHHACTDTLATAKHKKLSVLVSGFITAHERTQRT